MAIQMEHSKEKLRSLIAGKLFWNFRNAPSRRDIDYRLDLTKLDLVTDEDADWFIRTYESGILTELDGDFLTPRSSDEERIFWHGRKSDAPQRLGLAIEGIVGIGAVDGFIFSMDGRVSSSGYSQKIGSLTLPLTALSATGRSSLVRSRSELER